MGQVERAVGSVNRRYPERPMVGVGGLVFRGEEVLLVRRGHAPAQGQWSIPGGLVELGERLSQAVEREILEETGLMVETGPLVEVFEPREKDHEGRYVFHYVVLDYLCRYRGGELRASSDADEARWVGPEEEEELGVREITRKVIHKARKLLRLEMPE